MEAIIGAKIMPVAVMVVMDPGGEGGRGSGYDGNIDLLVTITSTPCTC